MEGQRTGLFNVDFTGPEERALGRLPWKAYKMSRKES